MPDHSEHLMDLAEREGLHPDGLRTLLAVIHGLSLRRSMVGDGPHIGAQPVVSGMLSACLERFGILTQDVLAHWGMESPSRIGHGVDVLVDAGFLQRSSDELDNYEELGEQIAWPLPPAPAVRELSDWGSY